MLAADDVALGQDLGVARREDNVLGRGLVTVALQQLAQASGLAHHRLDRLVTTLLDPGDQLLLLRRYRLGPLGQFGADRLEFLLLLLGQSGDLAVHLFLEAAQRPLAGCLIHRGDDVLRVVQHPIQVALRDVQ